MPINNQTPDPRFQRVLAAARELAKVQVDAQGTNVEWPVFANGLQRLRDALADLEGGGTGAANSIAKNGGGARQSSKGR